MPIAVDCHAHVLAKDLPITSDRHTPPDRDYTVAELLTIFQANSISHGLLTAPSYYLTDNSLLLAALQQHPTRLRGTVNLSPNATCEEIKRLAAQGICGVRLNWWRKKKLPDIRQYKDLLGKMRDAEWHLELFVDGSHLPSVMPTIQESGVKLVLDHFGCPEPSQGVRGVGFRAMLAAMERGRTWVKLSAPYRLSGGDPMAYASAMLQASGPERLLWASDWPWAGFETGMTYKQCLDWLTDWVPDPRQRAIILSETPQRLFGFQSDVESV